MRRLRVGLIGLGVISKFYLAAIERNPLFGLTAVCDLRTEALTPLRDQVPCYLGHRSMLEESELDAVIVTAPNDAHGQICRDALTAGLPVCVEKPLSISLGEARELDQLAWQHGLPLFTAFHRRYNDNVLTLVHELDGRPPIDSMVVRYLERIEDHIGQDTWYLDALRCGGGCVADNGPNAFDLVRFFLGDIEVTGAEVVRDEIGTDRQARIALRSAGGSTATVELDWSHPGETKDIEVSLTDGTVLRADMLAQHPGFKSSLWHEYVGILDDFAAVVATGAPGAEDGLAALESVAESYRLETKSAPTLEQS